MNYRESKKKLLLFLVPIQIIGTPTTYFLTRISSYKNSFKLPRVFGWEVFEINGIWNITFISIWQKLDRIGSSPGYHNQ